MIGKLKGIVDSVADDSVILDVGGVGYVAFIHNRLRAQLAEGTPATLTIETHVREDHIHLYGFADTVERDWFRLLTGVERVGGRMALAILGQLTPDQLTHAIIAKDVHAFRSISGVGPKLAERLVLELKDKAMNAPAAPLKIVNKKGTTAAPAMPIEDAVSALVNLGYTRTDAYRAATAAASEGEATLDVLIKRSLKQLVAA
jgi:holliday junction DNA helicase RuvA